VMMYLEETMNHVLTYIYITTTTVTKAI